MTMNWMDCVAQSQDFLFLPFSRTIALVTYDLIFKIGTEIMNAFSRSINSLHLHLHISLNFYAASSSRQIDHAIEFGGGEQK